MARLRPMWPEDPPPIAVCGGRRDLHRSRSVRGGVKSARLLAAAVAALVVLTGCGASGSDDESVGEGSSTTEAARSWPAPEVEGSTYEVPGDLGDAAPGDVLALESLPPAERLPGAKRHRLLYVSEDGDGRKVPVSGVILVPDADPPADGWPVVSWGHGTTGVADVCAPSLTDNLFYNEDAQEASTFLDAGYAVVATDYPGLGTPGTHSYLVGEDAGNAMVDIVTAARQVDPDLSATWFAVGHSQGGQAALFATRAASRAPDLEPAGAVSMAPASGLELALPAITAGSVPADLAYGVYMLAGLSTVDESFRLDDVLGSAGVAHRDVLVEDGCLLDTYSRLDVDEVDRIFSMTPEQAQGLSSRISRYANPEAEPVVGPVLVVQGEDDHDVPVQLTNLMVERFAALGSPVEYRTYPGLDHDRVIGPSVCDRLTWMARHSGPAVPGCVPYETDLS